MNSTLIEIREVHIEIEHYLQRLAKTISSSECSACTNVCCREDICNESITSDFLRFILGNTTKDYHKENGWFDNSSGCTLTSGRPFVCYEFFCSPFHKTSESKTLQEQSKRFSNLYTKVFRNKHILEIEDIDSIPEDKLRRLLIKLHAFRASCN